MTGDLASGAGPLHQSGLAPLSQSGLAPLSQSGLAPPSRSGTAGPLDAPGTDERTWAGWSALDALPETDIRAWPSVVVAAAHPDDEVLGVGGVLATLAAAGARIRVVAVTDGEASHRTAPTDVSASDGSAPGGSTPDRSSRSLARRRAAEVTAALRILGAPDAEVIRLRLPDSGLAGREAEIAAHLGRLADGFHVCLAPWDRDLHPDHEAVGRAAREAGLPVLWYPIWMWQWSFPADPRVPWHQAARAPLSPAIAARKRLAIRCFASQLEDRDGAGPVLSEATIAHFTRNQEVLFR